MIVGARAFINLGRMELCLQFMQLQQQIRSKQFLNYQFSTKEYQDVFEKKKVDMFPQHRPYDCGINLQEGTQPPFGPIYNLSQNELVALREYLDKNLTKNLIQHLKSQVGAPILFVKKKDVSLQML